MSSSRSRTAAACAITACIMLYYLPLLLLGPAQGSLASGQRQQHATTAWQAHRTTARRLQQNDFSGSTIPADFTPLDRAAETQRIYRSVAAERDATARALRDPNAAWQRWLVKWGIVYSSPAEAEYRRQVFNTNLERADKLNQLVGPEAAFGINRFSALTPDEFLERYTGDAQRDSGVTVTPDEPQMLNSSIAPLLADWAAGTFLTPRGQDNSSTPADAGNSSSAGSSGSGGGGPAVALPGAGGTTTIVPPLGAVQPPGGSTPGAVPGGLQPPVVRPPTGTPVGPTTPGAVTPATPPTATPLPPPAGGFTPPVVRPPSPPGSIPTAPLPPPGPPPAAGTIPPTGLPTPIIVQPGVAPGASPSPSPSPAPPGAAAPPPPGSPPASPAPGSIPVPSPLPVTVISPNAPGRGPLPPGTPGAPGVTPGVTPGAPATTPAVTPGGAGVPGVNPPGVNPPGVQPGGAANQPGVGGAPRPGTIPPTGRRRQLLQEQYQEQQQQEQQQQQDGGWHRVAQAVAAATWEAGQRWEQLLSGARHSSSSSTDLAGIAAGGEVGGTPPWLAASTDADDDGTLASDEAEQLWLHEMVHSATAPDAAGLTAAGRQLQQAFPVPGTACAKQVPWPFGKDKPMASVDWLRAGVVQPGLRDQSNCSNSYAFVAAGLAEATMALLGYNGSAARVSEAQLMACLPDANCSRGATTHVLLNSLACSGFAAAASGPDAFPISDLQEAAATPAACAAGNYAPVRTGITGWTFVPQTELAFAQALSRAPIKVAVDATILQSYRAGFIGCNVKSAIANHAMLAVGYSQRVRVSGGDSGSSSGGAAAVRRTSSSSARGFKFYVGGEYWMLRNSVGSSGSVDGYVYVAKGCGQGNVAPLGLLSNRGVMALFNASDTASVGRLQCAFPGEQPEPGCSKELLLKLTSFCARVAEPFPLRSRTNCSCSCIPA